MKNKKTFIGIVLLIAVLLFGIGYAAITRINGSRKANDANFTVAFTGNVTTSDDANVTASATEGATTATLSVGGLTTMGEFKFATYTVRNTSAELEANLAVITESVSNQEYFKVTTSIDDSTLAASGTTDVTVTVELIKTPTEAVTSDVNVKLIAAAVVAE